VTESGQSSILVVTRNLPPLLGGMERLVWHLTKALTDGWKVHVVGPEGCASHLPFAASVTEVPLSPLSRFIIHAQKASLVKARQLKPQWVIAGSGLTVPAAWLSARAANTSAAAYLHGLDITVEHPLYRLLWRPLFRHCDRIFVNSRFTQQLALQAGVKAERIRIVHPGVEPPQPQSKPHKRVDFRARHRLSNHPVMLYVGRLTARKGLFAFIQKCMPEIIRQIPEARLVVIGSDPEGALEHRAGERKRIEATLESHNLKDKIFFLARVDDDELEAAYFASDVLIFPVQPHRYDHEGFGMVALEAAAHGLPTVAFKAGGVPDAVAAPHCGQLIEPGDHTAFATAVMTYLTGSVKADGCEDFARQFVWQRFGKDIQKGLELIPTTTSIRGE